MPALPAPSAAALSVARKLAAAHPGAKLPCLVCDGSGSVPVVREAPPGPAAVTEDGAEGVTIPEGATAQWYNGSTLP